MDDGYERRAGRFFVEGLEGDAEAIGRAMARDLARAAPRTIGALVAPGWKDRLSPAEFARTAAMVEECCPGALAEIAGFAAELGRPPEEVAFCYMSRLKGANCTHAAIPGASCADGRPRVLRSYEWNDADDDLTLRVTRKAGKKAHIGCSVGLFGRMDGMNEDGLCVTISGGMAAGLPDEWRYRDGLNFWVAVRGLLENCATAEEGLDRLSRFPPAGNTIFLLMDAAGAACKAEVLRGELHTEGVGAPEAPLCAANHYELGATRGANKLAFILQASVPRLAKLRGFLAEREGSLRDEDLRAVAAREAPEGLFAPWYDEGFGTLWSSVFRPAEQRADYCLGGTGFNEWRSFGFYEPEGLRVVEAVFPRKAWGK